MSGHPLIRISPEVKERIDKAKPGWMSYSQYIGNLIRPVGEEEDSPKRFGDYKFQNLSIGQTREIIIRYKTEKDELRRHLIYIRSKHGVNVRHWFEASKEDPESLIATVYRLS